MFKSKLTKKAIMLVYKAYLNDFDNDVPKVIKLYEIASKLTLETEQCTALLMDVIDDKKLSFESLQKEFHFEISEAVRLLSKDDLLSFPDYIRRIKTNEIARNVKIVRLEEELKSLTNINKEKHLFALKILK